VRRDSLLSLFPPFHTFQDSVASVQTRTQARSQQEKEWRCRGKQDQQIAGSAGIDARRGYALSLHG